MKKELKQLLKEYIDSKYERAGQMTGVFGNNAMNRDIVERIATLEDFLTFIT